MTKLASIAKSVKLKTSLTATAILVAAFLSGCASKVDVASEQNLVSEFIAKANIIDDFGGKLSANLTGADETNWWQKLD